MSASGPAPAPAPAPAPGWYGANSWFAWWHPPAGGQARAAALLVPSMGAEQLWAYRGLLVLAERLSSRGIAVLRPDWVGTGNSGGDLDRSWPAGHVEELLREAAGELRRVGAPTTLAIGFRAGALALSSVAASLPVSGVVLWDPPASGRRWVRAQQALNGMAGLSGDRLPGGGVPGGLELPGFTFDLRGRAALMAMRLAPVRDDQGCRVLHHPSLGPPDVEALRVATGASSLSPLGGSDALLYRDELPDRALDVLVATATEVAAGGERSVRAPSPRGVLDLGGGALEHPVPLRHPALHVMASGSGAAGGVGPPVLFVGTANEPSWGPGRLWVHLARRLALAGRASFRVDLSGVADSPPREGSPRFAPYHAAAPLDIVHVVSELCSGAPDVVGSCSGAYNGLEAAASTGVRSVTAINPILDAPADLAGPGARRLVGAPRRRYVDAARRRLPRRTSGDIPRWAWRLLDAARLQPSPAAGLPLLGARGTAVRLICGDEDSRRYLHRSGWIIDRLAGSGELSFEHVAGLDHALLAGTARAEVLRLLEHHLGLPLTGEPSVGGALAARSPRAPGRSAELR